jgi:hypothetical protein
LSILCIVATFYQVFAYPVANVVPKDIEPLGARLAAPEFLTAASLNITNANLLARGFPGLGKSSTPRNFKKRAILT